MQNALLIAQIAVAVTLMTLILLQTKGKSTFTRRGLERLIFKATFVVAGLFILISILQLA